MSAADPAAAPRDPALVVEALGPLLGDERRARIEQVLDARLAGLQVVLEGLHDPHNGAAALRSCEAVGILEVHAIEAPEPFRFSARVTQGCDKWLELRRHRTLDACYGALRGRGVRLYAAVPGAERTLVELPFDRPAALVFGNEHAGLTAAARAGADAEFTLPMRGFTRSLNLSVAVALATAEAARRRRDALGRDGDLTDEERARLRARYYARDVRGAAQVIARHLEERRRPRPGEG